MNILTPGQIQGWQIYHGTRSEKVETNLSSTMHSVSTGWTLGGRHARGKMEVRR